MEPVTPPTDPVTPSEPPVTMPVTPSRSEVSITDKIQAICAVVQTVVFCFMVYSVFQTQAQVRQANESLDLSKKQFDLAQKQFEATIEPAIKIDLGQGISEGKGTTHFTFSNSGPVTVVDLAVKGILFALCTPSTNGLFGTLAPKYVEVNPKFSLQGQFTKGMVTNIPTEFVLGGRSDQNPHQQRSGSDRSNCRL